MPSPADAPGAWSPFGDAGATRTPAPPPPHSPPEAKSQGRAGRPRFGSKLFSKASGENTPRASPKHGRSTSLLPGGKEPEARTATRGKHVRHVTMDVINTPGPSSVSAEEKDKGEQRSVLAKLKMLASTKSARHFKRSHTGGDTPLRATAVEPQDAPRSDHPAAPDASARLHATAGHARRGRQLFQDDGPAPAIVADKSGKMVGSTSSQVEVFESRSLDAPSFVEAHVSQMDEAAVRRWVAELDKLREHCAAEMHRTTRSHYTAFMELSSRVASMEAGTKTLRTLLRSTTDVVQRLHDLARSVPSEGGAHTRRAEALHASVGGSVHETTPDPREQRVRAELNESENAVIEGRITDAAAHVAAAQRELDVAAVGRGAPPGGRASRGEAQEPADDLGAEVEKAAAELQRLLRAEFSYTLATDDQLIEMLLALSSLRGKAEALQDFLAALQEKMMARKGPLMTKNAGLLPDEQAMSVCHLHFCTIARCVDITFEAFGDDVVASAVLVAWAEELARSLGRTVETDVIVQFGQPVTLPQAGTCAAVVREYCRLLEHSRSLAVAHTAMPPVRAGLLGAVEAHRASLQQAMSAATSGLPFAKRLGVIAEEARREGPPEEGAAAVAPLTVAAQWFLVECRKIINACAWTADANMARRIGGVLGDLFASYAETLVAALCPAGSDQKPEDAAAGRPAERSPLSVRQTEYNAAEALVWDALPTAFLPLDDLSVGAIGEARLLDVVDHLAECLEVVTTSEGPYNSGRS